MLCCLSVVSLALPSQAKSLQILVGVEKPPYIQVNTKTGFELELLRAVAQRMGYQAEFIHVPNGRLLDLFQEGQGDLVSLQNRPVDGFFATAPYIMYQNGLIVRANFPRNLNNLSQLAGLRIMAFQNATQFLPPAYAEAITQAASYLEVVEQQQLPKMLLKQRVDVLVMDINIFWYYFNQTTADANEVRLINAFAENHYHLLARSAEMASQFDAALQAVKQSPHYQQLQQHYFPNRQLEKPLQ